MYACWVKLGTKLSLDHEQTKLSSTDQSLSPHSIYKPKKEKQKELKESTVVPRVLLLYDHRRKIVRYS